MPCNVERHSLGSNDFPEIVQSEGQRKKKRNREVQSKVPQRLQLFSVTGEVLVYFLFSSYVIFSNLKNRIWRRNGIKRQS